MNVTIICDASFCPDEKVGGYGYWIASERGKLGGGDLCVRGGMVQNSTVAEMMACCNSLHAAIQAGLVLEGDKVLMQTDCTAAIGAFEMTRYNLAEQERNAVKYMEQVKKDLGIEIRYRHVKGHSGLLDARSITNRLCDQRAKDAMRRARIASRAQKLKQRIIER